MSLITALVQEFELHTDWGDYVRPATITEIFSLDFPVSRLHSYSEKYRNKLRSRISLSVLRTTSTLAERELLFVRLRFPGLVLGFYPEPHRPCGSPYPCADGASVPAQRTGENHTSLPVKARAIYGQEMPCP
jgi:hypothetical protein